MWAIQKKRPSRQDENIQPLSRTDKRCLAALAALWLVVGLVGEALDGGGSPVVQEVDKPPVEITWEAPLEEPQLLEAITLQLELDPHREDIPLDRKLQETLWEACEESSVPISLALGLIETESGFQPEADNGLCYGLCQLNRRYYPADLTPAENLQAGIAHLGELLERYGDSAAALTAYNAGHDTGSRTYAAAVLAAAEKWKED